MTSKNVQVENIHCEHCADTIGRELGALEGVTSVRVDADAKTVHVKWKEGVASWEGIRAVLVEMGYPPRE